jgi:hypothetical protein
MRKGSKNPAVWTTTERKCATCHKFKPFSDFHKFRDTLQGSCKSCAHIRKMAHRAKIRELIDDAKSKPCVDCGKSYPIYVMDFDHMRDKQFLLSRAGQRGYTLEQVKAEMAKCEVVCANCHRIRTYTRAF